jgi:hypothetical protein
VVVSSQDRLVIAGEMALSRDALHQLVQRYPFCRLVLFGSAAHRWDMRALVPFLTKARPGYGFDVACTHRQK